MLQLIRFEFPPFFFGSPFRPCLHGIGPVLTIPNQTRTDRLQSVYMEPFATDPGGYIEPVRYGSKTGPAN